MPPRAVAALCSRACSDRRHGGTLEATRPKSYFIDMDGVLMRGAAPIPGAANFIGRLIERGAKFLLLTNNSLVHDQATFSVTDRCS